MRAFVQLRELLSTHKDLARKIAEIDRRYDGQFATVFEAIKQLIDAEAPANLHSRLGAYGSQLTTCTRFVFRVVRVTSSSLELPAESR
jgi:hypothetical protein